MKTLFNMEKTDHKYFALEEAYESHKKEIDKGEAVIISCQIPGKVVRYFDAFIVVPTNDIESWWEYDNERNTIFCEDTSEIDFDLDYNYYISGVIEAASDKKILGKELDNPCT